MGYFMGRFTNSNYNLDQINQHWENVILPFFFVGNINQLQGTCHDGMICVHLATLFPPNLMTEMFRGKPPGRFGS